LTSQVTEVMSRHNPINVQERAASWREAGWSGYDPDYAYTGTASFDENFYRNHYNSYYAVTGRPYSYYEPAYRYGYTAASDDRYAGRSWEEIEPELRQGWETTYRGQGIWEDIKDGVRQAWESITDAVVPDYDANYYWNHYNSYYSSTNQPYSYYEPAYHYGYTIATDDRYRNRSWPEIEPEVRTYWETNYRDKGAWEEFKDAVRHAWDHVTAQPHVHS
jgi:hypothetical protein